MTPMQQTKKNPLSLAQLFSKSFNIAKATYLNLILTIFFIISIVLAFLLLSMLVYYLLFQLNIVNAAQFFTFRLIWQIITYIITLSIAVTAQILIINFLLNPKLHFKANLKSIKPYFLNFFILSIIINILFFIATLPIYVGLTLFIFDFHVLGAISFVVGAILTLLLTSYLIFSSFFLIEYKLSALAALKSSYTLAKYNILNIIFKIIVLALIIIILNSLMIIFSPLQIFGTILSAFVFIIMILLSYTYLFAIYKDFKSL